MNKQPDINITDIFSSHTDLEELLGGMKINFVNHEGIAIAPATSTEMLDAVAVDSDEATALRKELEKFELCVDRTERNGRYLIDCKLGLWGVDTADEQTAFHEAFHYWQQYAGDGEYSSIIGGESVLEKLSKKY